MLVRILGFVKRELGELLLQKVVSQPPLPLPITREPMSSFPWAIPHAGT